MYYLFRISRSEVSDYYEGTGYFKAFLKEPDRTKRRIFKFHINSRETNALLFYIGNEVYQSNSYWHKLSVQTVEGSTSQVSYIVLNTIYFVFCLLQESFFCVFLERGFLVLQGWQGGHEIRRQSAEKVSLFVRRSNRSDCAMSEFVPVHKPWF